MQIGFTRELNESVHTHTPQRGIMHRNTHITLPLALPPHCLSSQDPILRLMSKSCAQSLVNCLGITVLEGKPRCESIPTCAGATPCNLRCAPRRNLVSAGIFSSLLLSLS